MPDITITLTEEEAEAVSWAVLNATNWPGGIVSIAKANSAIKKIEVATKESDKKGKK